MKIPEHAKLVFKGKIFDTYQWEQEMFDGSIQIFEKLKKPDTVDIIAVSEDGYVSILEEEQPGRPPFYGLVGGTCEEGEDTIDTAKRELSEETGYVSNDWTLFKTYTKSSKIDYKNVVYIARDCKKIQDQNLDAGEKIIIKKVSWKEFLDIIADPKFRAQEFALDALRYLYLGKEEELKNMILKGTTL